VSGQSSQLESLETSFQQDLNGDGIIGLPPPTVIATAGPTTLLQSGSNYLIETADGSTVELSYGGAPIVAGQFGGWTPIAAQQTASGYEVALKLVGADQYTVWYLDNSGNYLSSPIATASGESSQLESIETSFQYDLNGDGIVGLPPPRVIATAGPTTLLEPH
jgi:serralysin